MTNKERINYIKEWLKDEYALNAKDREILSAAIKAFEELPKRRKEVKRWKVKALEQQEPCEDCISRENTLKAMIEQLGIRNEDYLIPAEATLYKVVKRMPPVTPQPKTGHWIKKEY